MSTDQPTFEEFRLLQVLVDVCQQFMDSTPTWLDHNFLSAGEHAVEVLQHYGLLTDEPDGRGGRWTTRGAYLGSLTGDVDTSTINAVRAGFLAIPPDWLHEQDWDMWRYRPDLRIGPALFWFHGFVRQRGPSPPWPPMEPDRLDVTIQASGSEAHAKIRGELFTLTELRAFAAGLRRVATGIPPWVDLHGTAGSLKLTPGQDEHKTVLGQVVLSNPMFDHAHRFGIKGAHGQRLTDIAASIETIADRLGRSG